MNRNRKPSEQFLAGLFFLVMCSLLTAMAQSQSAMIPQIDGDWWEVAGNPDLGAYSSREQQPVAAPEIISRNNEYYIAALLPGIKGIRIAKLKWVPIPQ